MRLIRRRPSLSSVWVASLCLLGLVFSGPPAEAGQDAWTPLGPGGGGVEGLAVDPSSPRTLWAAEQLGIYKSEDGGASWARMYQRKGLTFRRVAVDPSDPDTVFAGGINRIVRSTDGGRTWTELPGLFDLQYLTVVPGPSGAATVYAGGYYELFKSTDEGNTWLRVFKADVALNGVAVDPRQPQTVYGIDNETILKSVDGGTTWQVSKPPTGGPIFSSITLLALAPSRPQTLYAYHNAHALYRSTDAGATWTSLPLPSPDVLVGATLMLVDPVAPSTVYLAGPFGAAVSTDGGASWQPIDGRGQRTPALPFYALAIDPTQPQNLYAGHFAMGVGLSHDGGASWRFGLQPGLWDAGFSHVRLHPRVPGRLYAFATGGPGRAYRSHDGGRTWLRFARALGDKQLFDVAFDPAAPETILYAAALDGIYKSVDGGVTWALANNTALLDYRHLAATGRGQLLAARSTCGLNRTADGGRTWQQVLPCTVPAPDGSTDTADLVVRQIVPAPANPSRVYAVVELTWPRSATSLLYISRDGGATWKAGVAARQVAVDPARPNSVYAVDLEGYVLHSTNGGRTWGQLGSGLRNVVVDPRNPQTLYGAYPFGVVVSTNGGITWVPSTPEFPDYLFRSFVQEILADPFVPGHYYAVLARGPILEVTFSRR